MSKLLLIRYSEPARVIIMAGGGEVAYYKSILSSSKRDYLVRNNGDQITIDSLKGKKIGLYFSTSCCGPCQRFTPILVEAYNEISSKGDFEIILVTTDEDDESFRCFSKMRWLAIPFSDSAIANRLDKLFEVSGFPHFGKVVTENGVELFREYGVEAYSFTSERMKELNDEVEKVRRNQSLRSILVSPSRDFVISSDGRKVLVYELEGRTMGLYFSVFSYKLCDDFTPQLVEVYEKLKAKGGNFEIVLIPLDDDEELFNRGLKDIPWLSLPFKDKSCEKLAGYFELSMLPTLVIIGTDGKTLQLNVVEAIEEHGIDAFPFTPEKFEELVDLENAKVEGQALKSVLFSGDGTVIGKNGVKIPVSEMMGKNILIYFAASSGLSDPFLPKLIKAYHEIKAKDSAFEVILASLDVDQASFDEFFARMPWVAFPWRDRRVLSLYFKFKINGRTLVAIGPSGQTLTKDAMALVWFLGADAYPFTRKRLKELKAKYDKIAKKRWPEKVVHAKHGHELVFTRRRIYTCDGCKEQGGIWSYCCKDCNFDLHTHCALDEKDYAKEKVENSKDGLDCAEEVFLILKDIY